MRLAAILALAAVVGACGSDGEVADSSANSADVSTVASGKACDVLTEADAKKALSRDVQKLGATGGPAGLDICQFGYQGEGLMDSGNASVTVQPVDLGSLRQGVTDQGFTVEPVAGLGDEAFWSPQAGLYVGKGSRTAIYLIGVGGESESQNKERAIALAKATVARL